MNNDLNMPAPFGIALRDIASVISAANLHTEFRDDTLVIRHAHHEVLISVEPPKGDAQSPYRMRCGVKVSAAIPPGVSGILTPDMESRFNRFAGMGALVRDGSGHRISSRFTLYEGESNWKELYLPLISLAAIDGAYAILSGVRNITEGHLKSHGPSAWTDGDFQFVASKLGGKFVCKQVKDLLAVQIPIDDEAVVALLGQECNAQLFMRSDLPHPAMGPGLFCLLRLPCAFEDPTELQEVCAGLNELEMEISDSPPHLGSWCPGESGTNPSYVSFFPNRLKKAIPTIALNIAAWSKVRANRIAISLASDEL